MTYNTHKEKRGDRGVGRSGAVRSAVGSGSCAPHAPGTMAEVIVAQEDKCGIGIHAEENNIVKRLGRLGEAYHFSQVKALSLPFFMIDMAAGFPIPLDNDERAQSIELLRLLCPNPDASYLIRVRGNSMIDANIHDGDIVIVDKSNRNPTENEVAVCELNGEYTIRRIVRREGCGWLLPANADYPEIKVTADDDFSVWGTVTYIIHKPTV